MVLRETTNPVSSLSLLLSGEQGVWEWIGHDTTTTTAARFILLSNLLQIWSHQFLLKYINLYCSCYIKENFIHFSLLIILNDYYSIPFTSRPGILSGCKMLNKTWDSLHIACRMSQTNMGLSEEQFRYVATVIDRFEPQVPLNKLTKNDFRIFQFPTNLILESLYYSELW